MVRRAPLAFPLKRTWSGVVDVVDGHSLSMEPQDAVPLLTWIEGCS